jgi:hypothetical protein
MAGALIRVWGVSAAFAASVVTAAIAVDSVRRVKALEPHERQAAEPAGPGSGRDDSRAAPPRIDTAEQSGGHPRVYEILALLAVFSTFGWNLDVVLPIIAEDVLGRGPVAFSALVVCLSIGSFFGSVGSASFPGASTRLGALVGALVGFGASLPLVAASDRIIVTGAVLIGAGMVGGTFLSLASAAIQTAAEYAKQGRVVAQYTIIFVGCRALGAPALGFTIDELGPREAIVALGIATAAVGALVGGALGLARARRAKLATLAAFDAGSAGHERT